MCASAYNLQFFVRFRGGCGVFVRARADDLGIWHRSYISVYINVEAGIHKKA